MQIDNLFIELLLQRSAKEWDIKTAIEEKASKIITTLGIIIPIAVAIFTTIKDYNILTLLSIPVCIFFGLCSFLYSIKAIKSLKYKTIINIDQFFYSDDEINNDVLETFVNSTNESLLKTSAESILESI